MKSKYFKIQELVSKETYNARGERAWQLIDPYLIMTIDKLKEVFPKGTITINNWLWGGDRNESGLRVHGMKHYSPYSMHSFGKAIDAIFSHYKTEEVRQHIIDNPKEFPYIKGIELGVSWLHIDTRNLDEVLAFYP